MRIYRPELKSVCINGDGLSHGEEWCELTEVAPGLFECDLPKNDQIGPVIHCRGTFSDGSSHEWVDPYSYHVLLSEWDLDRFREGHHHHIDQLLGAHPAKHFGVSGIQFSVGPRRPSASVSLANGICLMAAYIRCAYATHTECGDIHS